MCWPSIREGHCPTSKRESACWSSRALRRRRADYPSTGWAKRPGVNLRSKPCAFDDGRNNWQDGLIRAAEKLHAHLTIARAYDAKLLLTYPGIYLNGANMPTDPEALRRNAIAHFRAFLAQNPKRPKPAPHGGKRGDCLPDYHQHPTISPAPTEESYFEGTWPSTD